MESLIITNEGFKYIAFSIRSDAYQVGFDGKYMYFSSWSSVSSDLLVINTQPPWREIFMENILQLVSPETSY